MVRVNKNARDAPRLRKRNVQRAEIELALARWNAPGDTELERNDAREQRVEKYLRNRTNASDSDIAAIISDLPSYSGWEIVPGSIPSDLRQV